MRYEFDTKFDIGDRVYHKLPESPMGIVTGLGYSCTTGLATYYITFDPLQGEISCFEWELTSDKIIV